MFFRHSAAARGFSVQARYALADPLNRRRFDKMNSGLPDNKIAIGPSVTIITSDHARPAHECFALSDPEMIEEMKSFLHHTRDRYSLLDVGALYGTFSLAFASKPGSVAYAVEPSPIAYGTLCENLRDNPSLNVSAFAFALGSSSGKIRMVHDWIHLIAISDRDMRNEVKEVDVVTLDEFVRANGIKPDAIKIDTEGYELHILKGAKRYLTEHQPAIFLEVHPEHLAALGQSVGEVVDLVSEMGYRFYNTQNRCITNPKRFLQKCIRRVVCLSNASEDERTGK